MLDRSVTDLFRTCNTDACKDTTLLVLTCVSLAHCVLFSYFLNNCFASLLADRTNGRAYATALRLSSVCL